MTTTTQTFLDGNFAPVTEEVTAVDLPVTGRVPDELTGRLLRIGPNPMTPPDPATYHWFTGDGMVHGVRLREGRAEWYRNRWVRGDEVANTHVIGVDGRTFAVVEAGNRPVELTTELETVGSCDFGGTLDGSFSAHTHRRPGTDDLHAVTYHWSWDHIRHVVLGPDARIHRSVQIPVPDGPSVHDCAVTERYVVLFDLPVTFSMEAVSAGARFPYRWDPGHAPRVGLLPLDGDAAEVRWFDAPSCYVFHTLNAYDDVGGGDRDRVVVDLVRHPRMFASVTNGPDEGDPVLPLPHRHIEENFWRAIRYGLPGELIDFVRGEAIPARQRLAELVEWILPVAEEIGAASYLAVPERNAAERQIERFEEGAPLAEIYAEQVKATEVIGG